MKFSHSKMGRGFGGDLTNFPDPDDLSFWYSVSRVKTELRKLS